MTDETITLNPCQSLALRRMLDAMRAEDGLYEACPKIVRDAIGDIYMPTFSSAEVQIKKLEEWGEENLKLAERFGNKIRELEQKLRERPVAPSLSALAVLAERLAPQHLIKCGITSRRSEAEHLIAQLKAATTPRVPSPVRTGEA